MKTTIHRLKHIEFTEQEQEILKELNILDDKELIFDEVSSQDLIDELIEVNPENVTHKDFIMGFIKELKR